MNVMIGARFILRTIQAEGVDKLFMFVGGLIDPFLPEICAEHGLEPIVAANETGAVFAADGYARASGQFGAALMIGGPGAANAVPGMAAAYADRSPLLLITGETDTAHEGRGSFQDASALGLNDLRFFGSVTDYNEIVPAPEALRQTLRDAFRTMRAGEHPVHVSVPRNVQTAEIGEPAWDSTAQVARPRPLDREALRSYAEGVLSQATRIGILAGAGVAESEAFAALKTLAEKYRIPVATTFHAKGALPENHELSLGMFGYAGHPSAIELFTGGEIETTLVIGSSLNQRDTMAWSKAFTPPRGILQVDIHPEMLGRNYPVQHPVLGDARAALNFLAEADTPWAAALAATAPEREKWARKYLARPRFLDAANMTSEAIPIHPARVIAEARLALPYKVCVLIDSGAHRAFAGHYFPIYEANTLFSATGTGPMGWAISAAVGVSVARPGVPTVVFTGDGCMLQQGLEIQTAARHRLPILYVVFNNQALGNVYLRQKRFGPGPAALCELPRHDWASIARGFGLEGRSVTKPADLAPALADFANHPRPILLDVICDRDAATPVGPWLQAVRHPDIYAE